MNDTNTKLSFKSLIQKADELTNSNPAKAEKFLLDLLTKDFTLKEKLQIKIKLAYSLWSQSLNADSYKIYQNIEKIAVENSFEEELADAFEGQARFLGYKGNLSEGMEKVKKSIQIYKKLKLRDKESKASNSLAIILYYKGDLDEALVWFNNSLKIATNKKTLDYIGALGNSGLIFRARGNMEKALEFIKKGLNLAKENNLTRAISTFQNNMADVLRTMGDYSESKVQYEEALTRARKSNDKRNIGLLSIGFANYWIELGELDKAYELLKDGMQIYKEMDDTFGKILASDGFAYYWTVKGHFKKAEEYLLKALALNEKISVLELQISILILLAEIYEGSNEAYRYLEQASKLAREKNSDLARTEVLLQRGRNCINKSQFNEAKMILDEALWLSKKIPHIELQLIAMMLLSRCFLLRYVQKSLNTQYYELSIKYIQDVLKLTKEKKIIPIYIHALVIRGMLYSIQDETEKAEEFLNKAMEMARERGMNIQVQKLQDQLSVIAGSKAEKISKQQFKNVIISFAMEELRKATSSYVQASITEIELEDIFFVTYKLDEKIGAIIDNVENLDIDDQELHTTLIEVGSLYTFSLGQGQDYNEGLFGPLPFGKDKFQAIIYAKMIKDSTQISKRLDGKNFVLFTMVFPSKMVPIFYNRQKLTRIFEEKISEIESVQEINKLFLKELRKKIISEFMKDLSTDYNSF